MFISIKEDDITCKYYLSFNKSYKMNQHIDIWVKNNPMLNSVRFIFFSLKVFEAFFGKINIDLCSGDEAYLTNSYNTIRRTDGKRSDLFWDKLPFSLHFPFVYCFVLSSGIFSSSFSQAKTMAIEREMHRKRKQILNTHRNNKPC